MNLNRYFKNTIIFFIILFITFILLEITLRAYSKYNKVLIIGENNRVYKHSFFEEGIGFNSFDNFFTFKANLKNKRFVNFFFDPKLEKVIKVWDYKFSTNNYGLVQDNELEKKKKSIIFLGDSYTVGWGAEPWINNFNGNFKKMQVINGGQAGAGFWQISELEKHFSKILQIEKVAYIFINQDVNRGRIIPKNISCFKNYLKCDQLNSSIFTFPKVDNFDVDDYARKIMEKKNFKSHFNYADKIKYAIRSLYSYNYFRFLINSIRKRNDYTIKRNLDAILKLKNKYKNNIIFIQINSAIDIGLKFETFETKLVNKFFLKNNIKKFYCDMNNDLSFFYKYDFHPNKKGYHQIYECVNKILNSNL